MSGEAFAYFAWHRAMFPNTPAFPKRRPWRLQRWRQMQINYAAAIAYHGDIDGDFNYW